MKDTSKETGSRRNRHGSALIEFGPALAVFIIFIFVPLLDCSVIPIRFGIVYVAINQLIHRAGMSEKLSDAEQMVMTDPFCNDYLSKFGITLKQSQLALIITDKQNQELQILIPRPAPVPVAWQPDSANGPFVYCLQYTVTTEISPLFTMSLPWKGVPGLTSPASVSFNVITNWENLGRDPNSEEYYLNE